MTALTKFPSLYKTAQDTQTGIYWKVIAQDAKSKDDVENLLLEVEGSQIWWPVADSLAPKL